MKPHSETKRLNSWKGVCEIENVSFPSRSCAWGIRDSMLKANFAFIIQPWFVFNLNIFFRRSYLSPIEAQNTRSWIVRINRSPRTHQQHILSVFIIFKIYWRYFLSIFWRVFFLTVSVGGRLWRWDLRIVIFIVVKLVIWVLHFLLLFFVLF